MQELKVHEHNLNKVYLLYVINIRQLSYFMLINYFLLLCINSRRAELLSKNSVSVLGKLFGDFFDFGEV